MGIYDGQMKQRMKSDAERFTGSFVKLAGVVMGDVPAMDLASSEMVRNALGDILKFYRIKVRELPDSITDINDQMDYLLNPTGVMRRPVKLTDQWYQNGIGAMLATLKDSDDVVALIPGRISGYEYHDFRNGRRVRVGKAEAAMISEDAVCFYRPLPTEKLGTKEFLRYCLQTLTIGDFLLLGVLSLVLSLAGLITPYVTGLLYDSAIQGSTNIATPAALFLIGVAISTMLFEASKQIVSSRIGTRSSLSVAAAMMARTLSLPAKFFKGVSAGEMSQRLTAAEQVCTLFIDSLMITALTSVFSLVYFGQIFAYARALLVPAMCVILLTLSASVLTSLAQLRHSMRLMEQSATEHGLVFSLIRGVPKIKLSGSERRAFSQWADAYAKRAQLSYSPPVIVRFSRTLTLMISSIGTLVLYYFAVKGNVGVPDYMAFQAAYGQVSGAFIALAGTSLTAATIASNMKFIEPLLSAEPETVSGKKIVSRLSGGIELNNVSFRYNPQMPLVLDDLSLKIKPGQYVAIVGATGCGKSTLMRLLLGFETPQKGVVYYDSKDLKSLDIRSLRKHIGVVMQDGKLFQGDVFSNIVISAPQLTLADAWEAAELADVAEDIHAMPMGMHTIISEGGGGISGGQKQRLMIARAVAPKPKLLMLDEATSALDNITQKRVSDALARLKCTRIVIAHRLSTIKQADQIIVLEGGKITETGNYDELIAKGGYFADLVKRQMVTRNDAS